MATTPASKNRTAYHNAVIKGILAKLGNGKFRLWKQDNGLARSLDSQRVVKYGQKGIADIIGIGPGGIFIAIEVKTGAGKLEPMQRAFMETITKMGGIHLVVGSVEEACEKLQNAISSVSKTV